MKTQLCQPNQKWICLLVSDLKKLWGLSHLVVIWIRMWGPACEPWFMCRLWSQQLVSWASTRTLLRKSAPSPNLHPQRDMHLELSSCPFYAHGNIYNFTQYCWMKVVLLQFMKTLIIGNIRERPEHYLRGATKCILPEVSLSLPCHGSWNCTRDPDFWVHQYCISEDSERSPNIIHCSW